MTGSRTRILSLVAALAVALSLAGTALAQTTKQGTRKPPPPFDVEKAYTQALGDERPAEPIDPQRLAAARSWVDQLDIILLVDQEIMGSARSAAEVLYQSNKDKHKNVRLFTEHEITPYLFKNSDIFRDAFAMSIADTLTVDEIKRLAAAGKMDAKDPLTPKTEEAGRKFDRVASFLAGALTQQMIATTNFSSYNLNLTIPAQAKE
jgi:hypothetical protein